MRNPGKISPTKAARILDVHVNTVYAWCRAAVDGRPGRLRHVKQHVNGYYQIDLDEVRVLADRIDKP